MSGAELQAALDGITRVPGVRGALLVGEADGLVVAEAVMDGLPAAAIGALACSLAGRLRRVTGTAGRAAPGFFHLQATEGALLVSRAGEDLLLVAVADPDVNVGLVRLELQRAAERIG